MRVGRLILVVATIVTVMVFPLLLQEALSALKLPSAYAAPNMFDSGGRVYQNGNFDPNNDDDGDDDDDTDNNDESDNEGEDNENDSTECYLNLNDNDPVPCDFEDNDNDPIYSPPAAAPAPAPSGGTSGGTGASASRCFSSSETGAVFLDARDYDVTVTVVNSLGAGTQLGLTALDPATVPAPPAGSPLLDAAVWQIDAMAGCGGASNHVLPAAVNLAFQYSVSANKAKLQIVHLENGVWVEVQTVPDPDPNKPYISATIQDAGTYAVIQKP